jgi:hypothetical protein
MLTCLYAATSQSGRRTLPVHSRPSKWRSCVAECRALFRVLFDAPSLRACPLDRHHPAAAAVGRLDAAPLAHPPLCCHFADPCRGGCFRQWRTAVLYCAASELLVCIYGFLVHDAVFGSDGAAALFFGWSRAGNVLRDGLAPLSFVSRTKPGAVAWCPPHQPNRTGYARAGRVCCRRVGEHALVPPLLRTNPDQRGGGRHAAAFRPRPRMRNQTSAGRAKLAHEAAFGCYGHERAYADCGCLMAKFVIISFLFREYKKC